MARNKPVPRVTNEHLSQRAPFIPEKDFNSVARRHLDAFCLSLADAWANGVKVEPLSGEYDPIVRRLSALDLVEETGSGVHGNLVQLRVIDDCPVPTSASLNKDCQALSEAASLAEGMTLLSELVNEPRRKALRNSRAFQNLLTYLECIVRKGMMGQNISPENFVKAAKILTLLTANPMYIMPNGKIVLAGQTVEVDA